MTRYAVYDLGTGTILWIVQCSPDMAALQATAGRGIIEAPEPVTDATHRVEGGVLVAL